MSEKEPVFIPYYVHEGEMNRLERINKRLFILLIIIFIAFVSTNAAWLWYESQFEDQTITQTVEQDSGDGGSNTYDGLIVGGDYNGEADSQDNN